MPINRTPPRDSSPLLSASAMPIQHAHSDSNVSELARLDVGISSASLSSNASLSNITLRQVTKRKRGETDDTCKSELMDLLSTMQKQQDDKYDAILSSIKDLKMSVDNMSTKYEDALKKIDVLQDEVKKDKQYIRQLENTVELLQRNARSTSLEIRNIPRGVNETKEDLKIIVSKLSEVLQQPLQGHEIKDVYRINLNSSSIPIVVDFTNVFTRNNILRSYKKYNKESQYGRLTTIDLKLAGDKKFVYVSENLTPSERKLFYHTREFAKTNDFKYCWMSFGKIYLRKIDGASAQRIKGENDLEKIRLM